MWTTIIDSVTVTYPHFTVTGPVEYDSMQAAPAQIDAGTGEDEVISVSLAEHDHVPGLGEVFVKDWVEAPGIRCDIASGRRRRHYRRGLRRPVHVAGVSSIDWG